VARLQIPKGNTAVQVNATAFKMLNAGLARRERVLDLPCGEGEWLGFLKSQYPQKTYFGADLRADLPNFDFEFKSLDMTKEALPWKELDLVTSISGIVCFGNHLRFFREVHANLKPGGHFLVTNDNHWTLRDRFYFLIFGSFKRFPLVYRPGEGNTQATTIMNVIDSLEKAGFELEDVRYTSARAEDYLWVPFAAILWLIQGLAVASASGGKNPRFAKNLVKKIYPFKALWCRHYLILAKKK
jgi:cyclopropane fatty-acyl-phospholipid synthase-like methyltransferase